METVKEMISIYDCHPHSCFLYLASILVDEYGQFDNCRPGLVHMLNILCSRSFKLLQGENGFRDHPDTIDDMFRLAISLLAIPMLLLAGVINDEDISIPTGIYFY
ncbi:unnamed protein product [Gongylonema pulchrum]|uniref:Rab-GAP TBC domain-containing protein n=1 Tax=Gongylonema pulchrum TaxID=637853 RepID=A0A183EQE5_9BILA|nr:unnamed protein product [Gongylonema pulchrum]